VGACPAEVDPIDARYPHQFAGYCGWQQTRDRTAPLADTRSHAAIGLAVLLVAVGFVLLIACATLQIFAGARPSREREIALRKALERLVRVSGAAPYSSLLLSFLGGILASAWRGGSGGLAAILVRDRARLAEAQLDASVLLYSLLLCGVTGILFGVEPALQLAGRGLQEALKEGSRGSSEEVSGRVRGLLVVAEMAVALVLITGAGLLIESFRA